MAEKQRTLHEVIYTCSNKDCRHQQTIRYFADDAILPVTCCVKCRAGFNVELGMQMNRGVGMFPGKAVSIAA